jgi:Zn-dependent M28 family amino/carboxypeptidase
MSEDSLVADVRWLVDPARAGRGPDDAALTASWIASELSAAGYTPVLQPIGTSNHHNVIASHGSGAAAMLVVAHYDHLGVIGGAMYPGADDNASGVAVALAVARRLRQQTAQPAMRVVFVFTGLEEQGLRGARTYVTNATLPLAEIRAVINLDMVGRELFGQPALLAAVGLPEDEELFEHATAAAASAGVTLSPLRAAMVTLVKQDHRSDDWVFRDAGISAVHLSSGIDEHYHQPTDTIDKIVPAQLVRTAKLVLALLQRMPLTTPRASDAGA